MTMPVSEIKGKRLKARTRNEISHELRQIAFREGPEAKLPTVRQLATQASQSRAVPQANAAAPP